MEHECTLCGTKVPEKEFYMHQQLEKAIIDLIKKKNPGWVEGDGTCVRCFEYFKALSMEVDD